MSDGRSILKRLWLGKRHRLQRKIMNPAFGPAQIRSFTGIFVDKAAELREVWRDQITTEAQPSSINVLKGLSRVTLDAIGSAGFDCDIGALRQSDNVLTKAFEDIFNIPQQIPSIALLQTVFPPLEYISNNIMRRLDHARKVMRRIGMQAIADRKAAVRGASADNTEFSSSSQSKDLLTLLVKANLGTGGADGSRLSDEEILAQIPTFLSTGHESTSTATAWCLYSLAQAPRIQSKLRYELLGLNTESPTMDDLVALPYLDMVVRETLRLHPPIASTMRVATKGDLIPLSTPYIDVDGQLCSSIRIAAGTPILIPILAMNTSRRYWGEDAHEFVPERWEHPPKATAAIPGVWSHMLTFLGGPRACIGYRLSLIEMKALIFTLLRTFEFSPAVDPADVRKMSGILHRPLLSKEGGFQSQLPLLVALAKSDRPV
ncbi:cytochrome P450 [Lenzites betulinus]|nr:cytochrome P450 [Lenzites betulinus]